MSIPLDSNRLPQPSAQEEQRVGETERTILIVDDDPLIRQLLQRFLGASGFKPLTAGSGREAAEVFRRHHADIDLVLMDVRMPGLSGPETIEELRRIEPELRYCYMSGDLGDHSPEDLLKRGALHLFAKPFAMHYLIDTLHRLTQTI